MSVLGLDAEPSTADRVNGRFAKGSSGNPAGRPPGSRNKAAALYRELLDGEGGAVLAKAIAAAKKGNKVALRLIVERLVPPARSGIAAIELPAIAEACDVATAAQEVIASTARGELTLSEAREWMALLERQRVAIETRRPGRTPGGPRGCRTHAR